MNRYLSLEYSAARATTVNAFYTSPTVIKAIYETVERMGFSKGNMLEPSMGIGNFFGLLPESMKEAKRYGVELDGISGRIAKQLYQNAEIEIKGFEATNFRENFFDLAIGNVPFGNYKVFDPKYEAQKFNLEVSFDEPDVTNDWDVWVYPAELPAPEPDEVYVTDAVDEKAKAVLAGGGKVLLLLAGKVEQGKDVVQYFTPSFWNTSWFKMRPPHTEGSSINVFHPVFRDFPTDFYTGLQWWELLQRGQTMELNQFPADFQPILQTIDTWFINRKLGMLFEARVGDGKILVCSADITSDPESRPVARQLNYSIRKYMASNLFLPEHEVELSLIEDLSREKGERLNINNINAPEDI